MAAKKKGGRTIKKRNEKISQERTSSSTVGKRIGKKFKKDVLPNLVPGAGTVRKLKKVVGKITDADRRALAKTKFDRGPFFKDSVGPLTKKAGKAKDAKAPKKATKNPSLTLTGNRRKAGTDKRARENLQKRGKERLKSLEKQAKGKN